MKKLTIFFLSLALATGISAQTFTFTPKLQQKQNFASNGDIIFFSNFINHSLTESQFTWVRIENTKPASWASEICDPNFCWDVIADMGDFIVFPGDTGIFRVSLFTNSNPGSSLTRLAIYLKSDPSTADTASFSAQSFGTSIKENDLHALPGVYPNPVTKDLNISYQADRPLKAEIYNLGGQKVASFTFGNSSYDASELSAGIYVVRLYDGDQILSCKFAKSE